MFHILCGIRLYVLSSCEEWKNAVYLHEMPDGKRENPSSTYRIFAEASSIYLLIELSEKERIRNVLHSVLLLCRMLFKLCIDLFGAMSMHI